MPLRCDEEIEPWAAFAAVPGYNLACVPWFACVAGRW